MRHFKGISGVVCLLFRQKQPEHDEACSGCLLAWGFAKVSVCWIGLLAFFLLATDTGRWPNWQALIPVLITSMILYQAHGSFFSNNKLAQTLGSASYSIYLWHWPVYVGLVMWGWTGTIYLYIGAIFSILLGWLSWRWIERPAAYYLNYCSKRQQALALLLTMLTVFCAGLLTQKNKIPQWRNVTKQQMVAETVSYMEDYSKTARECLVSAPKKSCFFGQEGAEPSVILVGDSHAVTLVAGMEKIAQLQGKSFLALVNSSCPMVLGIQTVSTDKHDQACLMQHQLLQQAMKRYPKAKVVISGRYSGYLVGLSELGNKPFLTYHLDSPIRESNAQAVVKLQNDLGEGMVNTACQIAKTHETYWVGPIPELGRHVPLSIARSQFIGYSPSDFKISYSEYEQRNQKIFGLQKRAEQACGVHLINIADDFLCRDGFCYGYENQQSYYYDDDHLSDTGSVFISPKLAPLFQ